MKTHLGSSLRPAFRKCALAFTLVELPIAVAIIAVLIGLLLPAVQRVREANNQKAALADMKQILAAEKTYFQTHSAYANAFTALGLDAKFPNGMADGYAFTLTGNASGFTAFGLPAAPGLTGSVDFRADQSGKIVPTPDAAAIGQHEQTTMAIQDLARQAIVNAIGHTAQADILAIARGLMNGNVIRSAFAHFDADHNGQVTVSEILNYSGLGSTEMGPLLTAIKNDFQFGTAGEDTGKISLTFAKALAIGRVASFGGTVLMGDGSSSATGAVGGPASSAEIAGFCDGSVRTGSALFLRNPGLFSNLTFFQAPNGGTSSWNGPITISDSHGNAMGGFLIGLLLPAVQTTRGGAAGDRFEGIVIALDATGVVNGGAGFGLMSLNFTKSLGDAFTGSVRIAAPQ